MNHGSAPKAPIPTELEETYHERYGLKLFGSNDANPVVSEFGVGAGEFNFGHVTTSAILRANWAGRGGMVGRTL